MNDITLKEAAAFFNLTEEQALELYNRSDLTNGTGIAAFMDKIIDKIEDRTKIIEVQTEDGIKRYMLIEWRIK